MKTHLHLLIAAGTLVAAPFLSEAATPQENWTAQCQKCHGPDGVGQTPSGKMLKVKDLTDPAVQDALTDDAITASIKAGMKNEKGKLVMPALETKIAAEDLPALVAFVRTFRKQ